MTIGAAALLCGLFTAGCESSHSALAGTFGGIAVATLVLPPLTLACEMWLGRVFIAMVSISTIGVVWLFLPISWSQWSQCVLILCGYGVAVAGSVCLLHSARINAVASSAIVLVIALAWLAWPIWLSPHLAGRQALVNWLVFAHPLLTLNGILIDQGIWTERPHMYAWTALNQDVSYSIPTSISWCVTVHALVGGACAVVGTFLRTGKREHESTRIPTNPHESDS